MKLIYKVALGVAGLAVVGGAITYAVVSSGTPKKKTVTIKAKKLDLWDRARAAMVAEHESLGKPVGSDAVWYTLAAVGLEAIHPEEAWPTSPDEAATWGGLDTTTDSDREKFTKAFEIAEEVAPKLTLEAVAIS